MLFGRNSPPLGVDVLGMFVQNPNDPPGFPILGLLPPYPEIHEPEAGCDADGLTECDYATGVPKITRQDEACGGKAGVCMKRHEAIHVGQMSECCRRASRYRELPEQRSANELFKLWQGAVSDWMEYHAHADSVRCFRRLLKTDLDCDCRDIAKACLGSSRRHTRANRAGPSGPRFQCIFNRDGTVNEEVHRRIRMWRQRNGLPVS